MKPGEESLLFTPRLPWAATEKRASMLSLLAAVQAVGLPQGGSLTLLAPGQKEMQCEPGCQFRPFCLPDIFCSEEDACATEPVVCTDETWESCKTTQVECPTELRAEMCANATDVVCEQRMGVEVYDRQAEAAERAAAEAEEKVHKPPKPVQAKKCMSMTTPKEVDWCTVTCSFDATSCAAAKLCKCSSFQGVPSDSANRVACDIACGCAELPGAKCLPDE